MKRFTAGIFFAIILCGLLLAINPGTVIAYQEGYECMDHTLVNPVHIDGMWTTDTEWDDAAQYPLGGGLNGVFRLKYEIAEDFSYINQYFLIEFLGDTTNDPGDYYQICYISASELMGNVEGSDTPNALCDRFDYTGHTKVTTLTAYMGDGADWVVNTGWTAPTDFDAVDTISASKLSGTPHWIAEILIEHNAFVIQPEFWIRVAAYDESNSGAGVQAWPTSSSRDVPNEWGLMTSVQEAFPETLGFGIMVLLSSVVAVVAVVGSRFLWKQPKTNK